MKNKKVGIDNDAVKVVNGMLVTVKPDYEDLDYDTVMTIPNKSLTPQGILDRFLREQPVPGPKTDPVFVDQDDDDDAIDFEKAHRADFGDKFEKADEYRAKAAEKQQEVDALRLKRKQEKAAKAEAIKRSEAEAQERKRNAANSAEAKGA